MEPTNTTIHQPQTLLDLIDHILSSDNEGDAPSLSKNPSSPFLVNPSRNTFPCANIIPASSSGSVSSHEPVTSDFAQEEQGVIRHKKSRKRAPKSFSEIERNRQYCVEWRKKKKVKDFNLRAHYEALLQEKHVFNGQYNWLMSLANQQKAEIDYLRNEVLLLRSQLGHK